MGERNAQRSSSQPHGTQYLGGQWYPVTVVVVARQLARLDGGAARGDVVNASPGAGARGGLWSPVSHVHRPAPNPSTHPPQQLIVESSKGLRTGCGSAHPWDTYITVVDFCRGFGCVERGRTDLKRHARRGCGYQSKGIIAHPAPVRVRARVRSLQNSAVHSAHGRASGGGE